MTLLPPSGKKQNYGNKKAVCMQEIVCFLYRWCAKQIHAALQVILIKWLTNHDVCLDSGPDVKKEHHVLKNNKVKLPLQTCVSL